MVVGNGGLFPVLCAVVVDMVCTFVVWRACVQGGRGETGKGSAKGVLIASARVTLIHFVLCA